MRDETYQLKCKKCNWDDTAKSRGEALDKQITHEIRNNSEGGEHVTYVDTGIERCEYDE